MTNLVGATVLIPRLGGGGLRNLGLFEVVLGWAGGLRNLGDFGMGQRAKRARGCPPRVAKRPEAAKPPRDIVEKTANARFAHGASRRVSYISKRSLRSRRFAPRKLRSHTLAALTALRRDFVTWRRKSWNLRAAAAMRPFLARILAGVFHINNNTS